MNATITFLLGRTGSGKSAVIFDALQQHQQAGERAFLIVPEQFTFEAEQRLIEKLHGLVGIEVLSFDRLAERVLSLSGHSTPYLNQEGLAMIVKRSILKTKEELSVFSRVAEKPGFSHQMATLITKFVGAGIDAGSLEAAAAALPEDTLLGGKLRDIALLYRHTEEYLKARYLTPDDALNAAAAALPRSFAAGIPVYIDGFEGATHAVYTLTRALFQCAKSVTVALTLDPAPSRDAEVFSLDEEVLSILTAMAGDAGLTVKTRHLFAAPAGRSREMAHLEQHLFAHPAAVFTPETEGVTLWASPSRQGEADRIADEIRSYVEKTGCRYRDIAVLASDLESYALPLSRAMESRGIPAFLDRREKLKNHALSRFLLASVRAAAINYGMTDLLSVLKSGFLPISTDAADELENYILRFGLRGTMLEKPLSRGTVPPAAEAAREILMGALSPLRTALAERKVSEKVRAVYDYLLRFNVQDTLKQSAESRLDEGRLALMQLSAQAWNRIMNLLDQLDAILGSEIMSREAFSAVLEEGFASAGVGLVPELDDGVLLGEALRTRTRPVEALFFCGVNEGLLPKGLSDDGILDDRELVALKETGLTGLRGTAEETKKETRGLYLAFSKAKNALFVSCALTADGAETLPSPLYFRLGKLFPNRLQQPSPLPRSAAAARARLAAGLSAWQAGETPDPLLPSLIRVLTSVDDAIKVQRMLVASKNDPIVKNLSKSAADALYRDSNMISASRLERYNACPFSNFASYGLAARERKVFSEEASDLGSLYHAVLDAFTKVCIARHVDYRQLSDEALDALLFEVLPPVIAAHNNGYFVENDRARGTLPLVVDTLKRALRAIREHLARGGFLPAGSELRFGPGCAYPPIPLTVKGGRRLALSGVIDRLDRAAGGCLRVIDYKTYGKPFDYAAVYYGLALQLPLYLDAVTAAGETPAGLYYMPISVPAPEDGEGASEALKKAFYLKGLTLNDAKVVDLTDNGEEMGSVVQGLKKNQKGEVKGSLVSSSEMRSLLISAKRIAAESAGRLLDGEIPAFPTKGSCDYCAYRACCRFESALPKCRTKKIDRLTPDAFFSLIGGGKHAMDD